MDNLSSLEKIREAEEKSVKMIEKANEEKARLVAAAREKAIGTLERYMHEMKEERESALRSIRDVLEKRGEKKTIEAELRIEKMKKDAQGRTEKQVDFLFGKFVEMASDD